MMPKYIGQRLVAQINGNGDQRIDHDEFVKFFLKLTMGNFDQKILIAFKCYDVDDDQCLDQKEVITVLKNVPIHVEGRYGSSFAMSGDN